MRNGSGTYIPPVNSWSPAVNGNSATSTDFNALLSDIASAISQSISADGQTPITADIPMSGNKITGLAQGTASGQAVAWEQLFSLGVEQDVASAATTDIGAVNSTFIRITGTTTITSFGTNYRGPRFVRFADSLLLTHNGSTLILPGNANITTLAGDSAIIRPIGAPGSGWIVMNYQRAASFINGAASLGANTFTGAQTLPGDATNALHAVPKQQLDAGLTASAPPGAVMAFAQNTAPTGWLKANGQLVSRTTYAALFSAIGTTYGAGDGSTTFALPDLRGEFVRGWDDGRGVDSGRSIGTAQGSQGNTFTEFQTERNPPGEQNEGVTTVPANGDWSAWRRSGRSGDGDDNSIRFRNTGTEVLPRNIALLYCIKF